MDFFEDPERSHDKGAGDLSFVMIAIEVRYERYSGRALAYRRLALSQAFAGAVLLKCSLTVAAMLVIQAPVQTDRPRFRRRLWALKNTTRIRVRLHQ